MIKASRAQALRLVNKNDEALRAQKPAREPEPQSTFPPSEVAKLKTLFERTLKAVSDSSGQRCTASDVALKLGGNKRWCENAWQRHAQRQAVVSFLKIAEWIEENRCEKRRRNQNEKCTDKDCCDDRFRAAALLMHLRIYKNSGPVAQPVPLLIEECDIGQFGIEMSAYLRDAGHDVTPQVLKNFFTRCNPSAERAAAYTPTVHIELPTYREACWTRFSQVCYFRALQTLVAHLQAGIKSRRPVISDKDANLLLARCEKEGKFTVNAVTMTPRDIRSWIAMLPAFTTGKKWERQAKSAAKSDRRHWVRNHDSEK